MYLNYQDYLNELIVICLITNGSYHKMMGQLSMSYYNFLLFWTKISKNYGIGGGEFPTMCTWAEKDDMVQIYLIITKQYFPNVHEFGGTHFHVPWLTLCGYFSKILEQSSLRSYQDLPMVLILVKSYQESHVPKKMEILIHKIATTG